MLGVRPSEEAIQKCVSEVDREKYPEREDSERISPMLLGMWTIMKSKAVERTGH
jgi:hypothetical protein